MINEQRGGKKYAANVTGPDGAYVIGTSRAPQTNTRDTRRPSRDYDY